VLNQLTAKDVEAKRGGSDVSANNGIASVGCSVFFAGKFLFFLVQCALNEGL
jgi:hypothetical protein